MPNILILSGSPIKDGSTELLLRQISKGTAESFPDRVIENFVRLNELTYIPCQSCGKSPEPNYCFFHDDIYPLYNLLVNCDIVLFGSPIYFDSVSAQAKSFIDRCNCLRPLDFSHRSNHLFKNILSKKRLGGMALVAGERQKFEWARKVIAGFFKWVDIEDCGLITYVGAVGDEIGQVRNNNPKMSEALSLGQKIAIRQKEKIA
ncbi:MAG: flavodoxin family protein [candidate division Zixibacteria bacterium]|nr:flavodoxin family protein [candidate division Zixibacteria bacterium]